MRLIDADKLKVLVSVENDGTITTGKLVTALFDDMETVEAIPIEWIKGWRKKKWFDSKLSMEERAVRAMVARMIVEDWEAENETN